MVGRYNGKLLEPRTLTNRMNKRHWLFAPCRSSCLPLPPAAASFEARPAVCVACAPARSALAVKRSSQPCRQPVHCSRRALKYPGWADDTLVAAWPAFLESCRGLANASAMAALAVTARRRSRSMRGSNASLRRFSKAEFACPFRRSIERQPRGA